MAQIHPVQGERRYWLFECTMCGTWKNTRRANKESAVSVVRQAGWVQIDRAWYCPPCKRFKEDTNEQPR